MLWETIAQSPTELAAECYDVFYSGRQDTAFFTSLTEEIGGPVLEVGCGTGRILLPVAKSGIAITGIDLSAENLAICRKRLDALAGQQAISAQVVLADMREFNLACRFNLAIFPFRTLQELLTADDKIRCLTCTRRHMQDGGFILIDNYNPSISYLNEPLGQTVTSPTVRLADGRRVRRTDRIAGRDLIGQTQECEIIYDVTYPDGIREQTLISYRTSYLFRYELEHLLARTGFDVIEIYGDYDRSPFGMSDPGELIVLARAC